MAKKDKEIVRIEDVELKPQTIGYSYKKKSNIGRVLLIFVAFILVVYYINDISVYINKLLGKTSAPSIEDLAGDDDTEKNNNNSNNNSNKKETVFYEINSDLSINIDNINFSNFSIDNKVINFSVSSNSDKKIYLETYSEEKMLLERFLIDVTSGEKSIATSKEFKYITLEEKNSSDYPSYALGNDGNGSITCQKDNEKLVYKFVNNELDNINHTSTISSSDDNYYSLFSDYQSKINSYNSMDGITASITNDNTSFTYIISIDLKNANLENVKNVYYYGYKEVPKVVKFEMVSRGFTCN